MGERNRRGRQLLVSCLSRVILEPQCVSQHRPALTSAQAIDPALISRAIIQETLSTQAHSRAAGGRLEQVSI
jgi:hypothetical protein